MKKFISFLLIIAVAAGCARHQGVDPYLSSDHLSTELELGEAIHQRIAASIPLCQNEQVTRYIQSVGEHLALRAGRKDLRYRFVVLEDDRIHATHAPGGFVYITTGFLEYIQNEIELAGVLAHELGHLQYKDPRFSAAIKAKDIVLQAGSVAAPVFGPIGALSLLGLIVVNELAMRDPSLMDKVKKADKRALWMMAEAGYDPQGLLNILHRVYDPHASDKPYLFDYLNSHPMTSGREAHLAQVFRKLPLADKQFDAGRDAYMAICRTPQDLTTTQT